MFRLNASLRALGQPMAEGDTDYLALVSSLGSHAKARAALRARKAAQKEARIARDVADKERALAERVQQREKRRFHTKGQPAPSVA